MCEATVYLEDDKGLSVQMRDAARIRREGGRFVCVDLVGNEVALDAELAEIDLLRHRVLFRRA